jgi:hypothetical protein
MVEFTDMIALETALTGAGIELREVRNAIRAHRLGGSERFLRERGLEALPNRHSLLESAVVEPLRHEFPEVSSASTSGGSKDWGITARSRSGSYHAHRTEADTL